jgi:hypothetical protein
MTKAALFASWMSVATVVALSDCAWAQSGTQGYAPPATSPSPSRPSGPGQSRLPLADPSAFSDNTEGTGGQTPGTSGTSSGSAGEPNAGKKPGARQGHETNR